MVTLASLIIGSCISSALIKMQGVETLGLGFLASEMVLVLLMAVACARCLKRVRGRNETV